VNINRFYILIKGSAVQLLYLHFLQRWSHSITTNTHITRNIEVKLPPEIIGSCKKHRLINLAGEYKNIDIGLERTWKGVFDTNYMFDCFKKFIQGAKRSLYVEHQYPFQNFALTYYLCEALKSNPNLKVIIVSPIKSDLPTGLVGDLFDWSQDHIIEHLHLIYNCAPDRVGIYGLVSQDPVTKNVKSIYVHSKILIVDDEVVLTGSTNMDNVSFFYSSELSLILNHKELASSLRRKLCQEHLGSNALSKVDDFNTCFRTFRKIAQLNVESLKRGVLSGRPVAMAPAENYAFLLKQVYHTSPLTVTTALTNVLRSKMYNSMDYVKQKLSKL